MQPFEVFFMCSRATPAKNIVEDDAIEITASATPPSSGRARRTSNADGLLLTKGGRVSMTTNEVNAKYDSSYRNSYSLYFPLAGHSDRLNIFKSAAFYALSDEELEEIVSCKNEPVLKAYMHGLFRAACRLWKCIMPVDARAVFQNDVFHPASVSPTLQLHLGLNMAERIFDK